MTRNGRTLWAALLLFTALTFAAFAQTAKDAQLHEALRLLGSGRTDEALRLFKSINRDAPDDLQVIRYLAELEFKAERWKNAKEWYDKLIDAAPDDADAAYHLGVIYRETGKYKAFILRDRDWNRSEDYFSLSAARPELFSDLYYQYALLQRYRENYARALELLEQQIQRNPLPHAVVAYFRFAESFIYNKGAEPLRQWAHERTGEAARFFVAESYRLQKEYAAADSIYALLAEPSSTLPRIPLYLAWSKLAYVQKDLRRAQQLYQAALDAVHDDIEAALMFDHIKYILSDQELDEYEQLSDAAAKRAFFKRLWLQRDPMPASETNYRLLEHIRRYLVAEREHYYDGFRLPFNNPDRLNELQFPRVFDLNDKFNDKGLVYIRHGEPDDRAFDVEAGMPLNESWLYYERGQMQRRMIFHFLQGETQTGNNWRLAPSLPKPLLESRISWDPIYSRILYGTAIEAIAYEREMVRNSREDARVGLNTDQHSWDRSVKTIIFPFYMATFREDDGLSRSELYYSITDRDVFGDKVKGGAQDSVTVNFAVYSSEMDSLFGVDKKIDVATVRASCDRLGYWPDQLLFIGPPDRYQFAVDVRAPNDQAIGGYKFKFMISDYRADGVKMSGVVLASSIAPAAEGSPFYKNGLSVVPNPRKLYQRKQPISIYFELYNLPVQAGKSLLFEIEYTLRLLEERETNILQTLERIFRNRQPTTSNRIERSATSEMSVEYIALDLRKYVPGIYELQINTLVPGVSDSVYKKINFELK